MLERDKQVTDQQKKHAAEKERREHKDKGNTSQPEQQQAGMSTDPEAMKDEGYQKRIEKKTSTH